MRKQYFSSCTRCIRKFKSIKYIFFQITFFRSGFQMSELFHTFGELDGRVRPLVFFVRTWAREYEIIQPYPSLSLSNFMLTCMAINFLQTRPKPVLPPSDAFVTSKGTSTERYITDSTSVLDFKSENTSTVLELLTEFFEYYAKFKFSTDAISITNGAIRANTSGDSIYIYNPLESGLNVSRNVTDFERTRFIEKCEVTHKALTMDGIDAVDVLEFWHNKGKIKELDSFVTEMVKPNQSPGQMKKRSSVVNKTTKFEVNSLLKIS